MCAGNVRMTKLWKPLLREVQSPLATWSELHVAFPTTQKPPLMSNARIANAADTQARVQRANQIRVPMVCE